jgi:glycosyltransferase involved in cell wall biosynthesis
MLGSRPDVSAILRASDIGVLSSVSEGLPLALLEYGMAGMAVVATDVGQCGEVLDRGRAGVLVPASDPSRLAEALVELMLSPARRSTLGMALLRHVNSAYDADAIMKKVGHVYDSLLQDRAA